MHVLVYTTGKGAGVLTRRHSKWFGVWCFLCVVASFTYTGEMQEHSWCLETVQQDAKTWCGCLSMILGYVKTGVRQNVLELVLQNATRRDRSKPCHLLKLGLVYRLSQRADVFIHMSFKLDASLMCMWVGAVVLTSMTNVRALTMLEESLTVMPKCAMWLLRIPWF